MNTLMQQASALTRAVRDDPALAVDAAHAFIARHHADSSVNGPLAEAHRALATALRSLDDLQGSLVAFDAGIELCTSAEHDPVRGRLLTSRSVVWLILGDPSRAFEDLAEASDYVDDDYRGVLLAQQTSINARLRPDIDPLSDWDTALSLLETTDHQHVVGDVYRNSGLYLGYAGRLREAAARLQRAADHFESIGAHAEAGHCVHSLGWVTTLAGDFVNAQQFFERGAELIGRDDVGVSFLETAHAESLLSVGLATEALAIASHAAERLRDAGATLEEGEAELIAAFAALHCGRPDRALASSTAAQQIFAKAGGRGPWLTQARSVAIRARLRLGDDDVDLLRQSEAVAHELAELGWSSAAHHAYLLAAELAAKAGDVTRAEALLGKVSAATSAAPVEVRLHFWLATARLRETKGDQAGAMRACHAGQRVIDQYAHSLGAIDVRAYVAGFATDLHEIGSRLAHRSRRPRRVLEWTEKTTATSLNQEPVRPHAQEELRDQLGQLRLATKKSAEQPTSKQLVAEQRRLHDSINRLTRNLEGGETDSRLDINQLHDTLGDHCFVSFSSTDGMIGAVTARNGRLRLHRDLCSHEEVDIQAATISAGLQTLGAAPRADRNRAMVKLTAASQRLDALLLTPLKLRSSPTVIAPAPDLPTIAWGLLPSLADRPYTISPSATTWLRSMHSAQRPRPFAVTLIAGPALAYSSAEIDALAEIYESATIQDTSASSDDILGSIERADLAHFACHCHYQPGNSLFTELEAGAAPIFVHDLIQLERTPDIIVLASCESGQHDTPGSELLGLTSSLLAKGTATVVATAIPLIDSAESAEASATFHRHLAAGETAAEALASMRQSHDTNNHRHVLINAAFNCYGSGR